MINNDLKENNRKGNKYGIHRVICPKGVLTQAAVKIDNDMTTLYANEILCDVISLNIDSASFTQLEESCHYEEEKIKQRIWDIVEERGKMQNPVTGSGGMFIGRVSAIGEDLKECGLQIGDKIASLVSLSMTPLKIEKIHKIHMEIDRVDVTAKAVLFESALFCRLPEDMSEALALAALDVAGAPAQTARLVGPGDTVLILGAAGKSGMLCSYEAGKRVGPTGRVVGVVYNEDERKELKALSIVNEIIIADATKPVVLTEEAIAANKGREYDVSICCVNVEACEMSAILPVKDKGTAYFFSMTTSFTRAALGAEGVGKDITMIIGNGYTKGHAEIVLQELRENKKIREIFDRKYK